MAENAVTEDGYGRKCCNGRRLCTIFCNERRLWQVSIAINVIGYTGRRRRSVAVAVRFRALSLQPASTVVCFCPLAPQPAPACSRRSLLPHPRAAAILREVSGLSSMLRRVASAQTSIEDEIVAGKVDRVAFCNLVANRFTATLQLRAAVEQGLGSFHEVQQLLAVVDV